MGFCGFLWVFWSSQVFLGECQESEKPLVASRRGAGGGFRTVPGQRRFFKGLGFVAKCLGEA